MQYQKLFILAMSLFTPYLASAENDSTNVHSVRIQQADSNYTINHSIDTIFLSKDVFALQVELKNDSGTNNNFFYASASTNNLQFEKAKIGLLYTEVEYFGLGRSCAMYADRACDFMVVNNNGCCDGFHYMQYTNSKNRNLDSISFVNNSLHLSWPIEDLLFKDSMHKVYESDLKEVFITIFIDRNLNNIIDEAELYNTVIIFQ